MEKTWKPTTAGILSIIAGVIGAIGGIMLAVIGRSIPLIPTTPEIGAGILAAIGIPLIILGIVAIVGGIYALRRRLWGLALAGSICSLICVWFLGIPAIIFAALGKGEFE